MTCFQSHVAVSFKWKRVLNEDAPIPTPHIEALKEDAFAHINHAMSEGLSQGPLSTVVRLGKENVPEEDHREGLAYTGWWSASPLN